jgi:hypothetical protein
MGKTFLYKSPFILAALLGISLVQAGGLSRAEYDADQIRIRAEYKADDAHCDARAGNAKDVCVQQAKATEKISLADLEYRYTGTDSDSRKAMVARADAEFSVANEKCSGLAGNAKDVCTQQAKADQTKALADVKLGRKIGAARTDAANDDRDADYKVAIERCDSYAGDAKSSCISAAKAKFDKS